MALGSVSVGIFDNKNGGFKELERTFLFMGEGNKSTNHKQLFPITPTSDLDDLFGVNNSSLKTQLQAAIVNSKDTEFFAYAISYDPDSDSWHELAGEVLDAPVNLDIEGIVLCEAVTDQAELSEADTKAFEYLTSFAKFLTIHTCVAAIENTTQSWSEYSAAIKAVVNNFASPRVSCTPLLHGNDLGVVMGRLCNRSVTIADSPMRTKTGPLVGLGDSPVDKDGKPLNLGILKDLANARFSVSQPHLGQPGNYWGDHPVLGASGDDFQLFEHMRVADKAARRVRIRLIGRIADRAVNNTASSMERLKTYLLKALIDMSQSIRIGDSELPGEIRVPGSDDIDLIWATPTHLKVSVTVAPYNSPKSFTGYIAIDLNRQETV